MPVKRKKKVPVRKKTLVKKKALKRKPSVLKKPVKKSAKKASLPKKQKPGNIAGLVTHYFPKVRAAVIKLKSPLTVGETIKIKGHTTDFTQTITSMQIDRVAVNAAKKGQEIGLLVDSRVRGHDIVYKT